MEKFTKIVSGCVPLPIGNIDTDQIIPARFLKSTDRIGFGDNLFCDWRYDKARKPIPNFVLNDKRYGGSILVVGENFGCGSSREHAAWAIYDAGFRVVISSFFADIFKNNALNNGLLPVQVSEDFLSKILEAIDKDSNQQLIVDLENQQVTIDGSGTSQGFDISSYKKHCLTSGFDDIDFLISKLDEVEKFETKVKMPV